MEELTRRRALAQGYWFAQGLLDPAPLAGLRREIEALCERCGWLNGRRGLEYDAPEFLELQREVHALGAFTALRSNAKLREILEVLLGGPVADQQGDVCRIVLPGAPEFATPAHQDQFFLKRPEEVWSAWIPLGDCPQNQGSLAVASGSNALGLLPHGERGAIVPPEVTWRYFDFRAGDVLFIHALTLHRALENRSQDIRISVDYRFCRRGPGG